MYFSIYICFIYLTECDFCPLVSSMCFKHGQNCYLINCGLRDWFNAKKICQKNGGELALVTDKTDIKKITGSIKARQNPCTNFWVGIYYLNGKEG